MNRDLGFVHRFEPGDRDVVGLLLHGTGGDENDLLPLGRILLPDAALLSPRGRVLENGMPRFFRRLAMGVFDVEDLKLRAAELADFVGEARVAYGLTDRRVIAIGYSNGANIAAAMLLLHPGILEDAVLLHAMVPFEMEVVPDLSSTRVLITGGASDPMIPPVQPEQLSSMLEAAGATVELRLMPGGHELTHEEVAIAKDWLDR